MSLIELAAQVMGGMVVLFVLTAVAWLGFVVVDWEALSAWVAWIGCASWIAFVMVALGVVV